MTIDICRVEDVTIDGYVINREPVVLDDIDVHSAPSLAVLRLPFAIRAGSAISGVRFEEKIVNLTGRIVSAQRRSRYAMELTLDQLKKRLTVGAVLVPGYKDQRYFNVQLINQITANWSIADVVEIFWSAQFLCQDPFAYAASASQYAPGATILTRC